MFLVTKYLFGLWLFIELWIVTSAPASSTMESYVFSCVCVWFCQQPGLHIMMHWEPIPWHSGIRPPFPRKYHAGRRPHPRKYHQGRRPQFQEGGLTPGSITKEGGLTPGSITKEGGLNSRKEASPQEVSPRKEASPQEGGLTPGCITEEGGLTPRKDQPERTCQVGVPLKPQHSLHVNDKNIQIM